jgi:8-oxo-dGTP pyrophosphatase MutT (NUDIX family)
VARTSGERAIATVSILGVPEDEEHSRVLLQRRLNPKETKEFRNLWELPQGKIYSGEHVLVATRAES